MLRFFGCQKKKANVWTRQIIMEKQKGQSHRNEIEGGE